MVAGDINIETYFLPGKAGVNVYAETNPLAKMPKKDREVLNRSRFGWGPTFITLGYSSKVKISVSSSNLKVATVKCGNEKRRDYTDSSKIIYYAWYEGVPVSVGSTKN